MLYDASCIQFLNDASSVRCKKIAYDEVVPCKSALIYFRCTPLTCSRVLICSRSLVSMCTDHTVIKGEAERLLGGLHFEYL